METIARHEREVRTAPMKLRPALQSFLVLLSILLGASLAAEEPPSDLFVGLLDEGRTYRLVDGQPILGRAVADFVVQQEWEKELAAFVERVLVDKELARNQISITDQEIDEEMKRRAVRFARRVNVDPSKLTLEELSRKLGMPLAALREQQRTQLGLKKILVQEGKLKADANLEAPRVRSILSERLEQTIKEMEVLADPEKLPAGVAVQIGEQPYPHAVVRTFIMERMGPLLRSQLTETLDAITLKRLVAKALNEQGVKALTEDDRIMHLSYQAALLEMESGVPDGRAFLFAQLKEQGLSVRQFMRHPGFTLDASLTCLARRATGEEDIRKEFEAHTQTYRLREKRLAHLFLRTRDPQGRGYGPAWEMPGHPQVHAFVAAERERRFAAVRKDIERLIPQASSNFATAVRNHSEDEETRRKDEPGLLGRLSERSSPPELLDAKVLKEALKLNPGQRSPPLRSVYGWHLIRCLDDQETKYEEARSRVYLSLLKQRRKTLLEDIRKKATIKDQF